MRRLACLLFLAAPSTLPAQQRWTVERVPSTAVPMSTADDEPQFATAAFATRLANGEIVIADGTDGVIRIADASGKVVRSLGRKGNGPGEFSLLTWVARCGADSLYAWDARSARLSVFHPVSGYVRQFAVVGAAGNLVAACSTNGAVAFFTSIAPRRDAPGGPPRQTSDGRQYQIGSVGATVLVVDADGATTRQVPGVTYGEMLMGQLTPGGGMGGMPRPLGHLSSFAFVGDDLVLGSTDSARVEIYGATATATTSRFDLPPVAGRPTAEQYARAIEPNTVIAPPQVRPQLVEFAKLVPSPDRFPAFSRLLGGSDGLVWLVTSSEGDPVTRLRAHRLTGEIVATLEIPAALTVFEVGADYVLGRLENADGEQSVVAYRYARR